MTRLTSRQQLDRTISERDWLRDVLHLARINGWLAAHFRPALTEDGHWLTAISGDKGFPDLVLVRGSQIIFAELKTEMGRLPIEQQRWLAVLQHAADNQSATRQRVGVYVWRPSHRETVARILARRVL